MEDFLKQLGIEEKGNKTPDGCYVIDLNEDQWARTQSKLDRSDLVDLDDDSSMVTYDVSTQQYIGEDYNITLNADLENGIYKLTIRED